MNFTDERTKLQQQTCLCGTKIVYWICSQVKMYRSVSDFKIRSFSIFHPRGRETVDIPGNAFIKGEREIRNRNVCQV